MSDDEPESNPIRIRAQGHVDLRAYATKIFAARPELQSLMMSVAQYWADEADDAVHGYVVGSTRTTPLWPHDCGQADEGIEPIGSEKCEYCCDDFDYLPFDDNGSGIVGFAAYCHDAGSQEEPQDENYLPYAIVRRPVADEEPAIEVVGHVLRGYDEIPDDDNDVTHPPARFDDRARELFEIACASPADDGPRRVLADYLLEQGDPRGEYMSLALASELDDEAARRRDELLAEYGWSWMFPLVRVALPLPIARFERGLLAHVDVYTRDFEAIAQAAGSIAWASVESVRILPDSYDVLDPAMISLRRLGPIGTMGLAALAAHTWPIEQLEVRLDSTEDWPALRALSTLPRLRELTISGRHVPVPLRPAFGPDDLTAAAWWPHLDRFTVLAPRTELESLLPWLAANDASRPRTFAIAEQGHHGGPAGWEIAYLYTERLIEVRMPAFSASGRRARLIELLDRAPDARVRLIGGRCWQPNDDDVAALAATGREVTIG